jgi:ribonucleoside-diphosphate reductase beta chain
VKLEDSFIDRAFKLGGVDNLDKEDVKKYVRYVADYRLQQLGFKKNWHVKENPLEWIDSMMGKTFGNFFEREVVEYSKANLEGEFADAYSMYQEVE